MLLAGSSRPIMTLSLPLRSNSWLSASTSKRACKPAGAGAAACSTTGAIVGTVGAGVPCRGAPQFEQKLSPAALVAPHDGHVRVSAAPAMGVDATAVGAEAAPLSGSPHSSQNAEPSGFSWPKEHFTVILFILPVQIVCFPCKIRLGKHTVESLSQFTGLVANRFDLLWRNLLALVDLFKRHLCLFIQNAGHTRVQARCDFSCPLIFVQDAGNETMGVSFFSKVHDHWIHLSCLVSIRSECDLDIVPHALTDDSCNRYIVGKFSLGDAEEPGWTWIDH